MATSLSLQVSLSLERKRGRRHREQQRRHSAGRVLQIEAWLAHQSFSFAVQVKMETWMIGGEDGECSDL